MVVIFAGIGWLLLRCSTGKITVASSSDEKNIELLLADGSKVYLNHDSKLTYPKEFGRTT